MKNLRLFIVILAAIIFKMISVFMLKQSMTFELVPRSLTGAYFFASVNLIDILIPVLILIVYWKAIPNFHFSKAAFISSLRYVSVYVILPIITGLLLTHLIQFRFIEFRLQYVLNIIYMGISFLAIQVVLDQIKTKVFRILTGGLLIIILGVFMNYSPDLDILSRLFSVIGTPGIILALSIPAMRKLYKNNSMTSVLTILWIGLFLLVFPIGVRSDSYLSLLLPLLASWAGILVCISNSIKKIGVIYLLFFSVASAINFGLVPYLEKKGINLREDMYNQTKFVESYDGINVHFNDTSLIPISRNLARLLSFANTVAKEEFGIAPEIKDLYLYDYGPGGFYVEFPATIRGRFLSKELVNMMLDSAFLNQPNFNIHFPDPVNAILHEYSHLFGNVNYFPWKMGPEEEGWATFSATVLAKLIYEKYGNKAWDPPYPYHQLAEKIEKCNLNNKAVFWSHPDEFTGFQLWYKLAQKTGMKKLYIRRWKLTSREGYRLAIVRNCPQEARKLIAEFGESVFSNFKEIPSRKIKEIYEFDEIESLIDLLNLDKKAVNFLMNKTIRASIKMP